MANLDLDIDFNGLENDILNKSNSSRPDIYPRVVKYASSKGVSKREVDNIMLEVAGNYSSMTDEEIGKKIQSDIDKKCEPIYEKDGAEAFNECRESMIEKYKKKELRKSKRGNFWQNVIKGVNTIGGLVKDTTTTSTGQNLGESETKNNNLPDDETLNETRILGMKPLVFTVVALGTVTTLAIVTVLLMRKSKK